MVTKGMDIKEVKQFAFFSGLLGISEFWSAKLPTESMPWCALDCRRTCPSIWSVCYVTRLLGRLKVPARYVQMQSAVSRLVCLGLVYTTCTAHWITTSHVVIISYVVMLSYICFYWLVTISNLVTKVLLVAMMQDSEADSSGQHEVCRPWRSSGGYYRPLLAPLPHPPVQDPRSCTAHARFDSCQSNVVCYKMCVCCFVLWEKSWKG